MQLVIDGRQVVLSDGMSVELYSRNPFFTKEGEYTLDIDIDLREPGNAALYANIQRSDFWHRPVGRRAVLYNEMGVIINGTEVVLEIDGSTAKIQIVGGNSELNYIAGGDKTLRSLDLGSVGELTPARALASVRGRYPDFDFVCAPVLRVLEKPSYPMDAVEGFAGQMMDASVVTSASVLDSEKTLNRMPYPVADDALAYADDAQLQALPYLCAIIRRVFTALGLEVEYNVMEENEFSQLVIVHSYRTDEYAKMLEGWKVIDFIEQYEYLAGVVTLVDGNRVRIVTAESYYRDSTREVVAHGDVLDDMQKKFDQSRSERSVVYRNVYYTFPSSTLCKFYDPGRDTLERMEVIDCGIEYADALPNALSLGVVWIKATGMNPIDGGSIQQAQIDAYKAHKLYSVEVGTSGPVLHGKKKYVIQNVATQLQKALQEVGQFSGRYDDRTEDAVELKLVPAELYWSEGYGNEVYDERFGIPVVFGRNGSGESPEDVDSDKPGVNIVINGYSEEARPSDTMSLAFYFGLQQYKKSPEDISGVEPVVYPVLSPADFTTATFRALHGWPTFQVITSFEGMHSPMTLEILGDRGLYERYYKDRLGISETTEYVFRFRHNGRMMDARKMFVIGGRLYYCKELKYEVTNNRMRDLVEGVFYPAGDA